MNSSRRGRGRRRPTTGFLLALLLLAVAFQAKAEESTTALTIITAEEAADMAAAGARGVVDAEQALADALEALADAEPWMGMKLTASGSYALDMPAKPAGTPYAVSGTLSVPLLTGLSASVGARFSDSLSGSGSVSWSPLASTEAIMKLEYDVRLARIALDAARRTARLEALDSFLSVLSAEASRDAAAAALARAKTALVDAEAAAARGELGTAMLARTQAAVPRAQAALGKAETQARSARRTLAERLGDAAAESVLAGVPLDATSLLASLDAAWVPPTAKPEGAAVQRARALLEYRRALPVLSGSGPLTLTAGASLGGDGASISLGGALSLDWKTASGMAARSHDRSVADAEDALADALSDEAAELESAVAEAEAFRYALEEARAVLVAEGLELASAQVLASLGELTRDELAEAVEEEAAARLAVLKAALELARARLATG